MIKYFTFIIIVNMVFLWLLIHFRKLLKLNKKTAYTISGTTLLLTFFFPLALSFLEMSQILAVIFLAIGAVSVYLGLKSKSSPVPVLDSVETVNEIVKILDEKVKIPDKKVNIPDKKVEIPDEIRMDVPALYVIHRETSPQFNEEEGKKAEDVVILEDIVTLPILPIQDEVLNTDIPEETPTEIPTETPAAGNLIIETSTDIEVLEIAPVDNMENKVILDDILKAEEEVAASSIENQPEPAYSDFGEPDKPEYYIGQGFNAKFDGDLTAAINFFQLAVEFSLPEDLMQMISLDIFSMYKELGRYIEAKDFLNKYLKGHGDYLSFELRKQIMLELEKLRVSQGKLSPLGKGL